MWPEVIKRRRQQSQEAINDLNIFMTYLTETVSLRESYS